MNYIRNISNYVGNIFALSILVPILLLGVGWILEISIRLPIFTYSHSVKQKTRLFITLLSKNSALEAKMKFTNI